MAKKKKAIKAKVKKKPAGSKAPKKKVSWRDFDQWWSLVAGPKVRKMEAAWIKDNEPNDPDDDGGGDHWHVNEMMHNGDAEEMTAEISFEIFEKGRKGEPWEMAQENSLYCELDAVIEESYEAGKKCKP